MKLPRFFWRSRTQELERQLAAQRNQIEYLIREIRKMDDIIFSISQCSSWPQMQPRIAQLTDQMTARKVAESNRINDLIVGELRQTYLPPDQKLLGTK